MVIHDFTFHVLMNKRIASRAIHHIILTVYLSILVLSGEGGEEKNEIKKSSPLPQNATHKE